MGVLFYNNKVLDSANYLTRLESVTNVARRNGISGSFLSALPEELKIRILHHVRLNSRTMNVLMTETD